MLTRKRRKGPSPHLATQSSGHHLPCPSTRTTPEDSDRSPKTVPSSPGCSTAPRFPEVSEKKMQARSQLLARRVPHLAELEILRVLHHPPDQPLHPAFQASFRCCAWSGGVPVQLLDEGLGGAQSGHSHCTGKGGQAQETRPGPRWRSKGRERTNTT